MRDGVFFFLFALSLRVASFRFDRRDRGLFDALEADSIDRPATTTRDSRAHEHASVCVRAQACRPFTRSGGHLCPRPRRFLACCFFCAPAERREHDGGRRGRARVSLCVPRRLPGLGTQRKDTGRDGRVYTQRKRPNEERPIVLLGSSPLLKGGRDLALGAIFLSVVVVAVSRFIEILLFRILGAPRLVTFSMDLISTCLPDFEQQQRNAARVRIHGHIQVQGEREREGRNSP
jgi:hypothetical protein